MALGQVADNSLTPGLRRRRSGLWRTGMNSGMMITAARQRHARISGGSGAVLAGLTPAMALSDCAAQGEWLASAEARPSARRRDRALLDVLKYATDVAAAAFR